MKPKVKTVEPHPRLRSKTGGNDGSIEDTAEDVHETEGEVGGASSSASKRNNDEYGGRPKEGVEDRAEVVDTVHPKPLSQPSTAPLFR